MEKISLFLFKSLRLKEIKTELYEVHGTSAHVFATVYNWLHEFKRSRTSTNDGDPPVRSVEVTSSENIDIIDKSKCDK